MLDRARGGALRFDPHPSCIRGSIDRGPRPETLIETETDQPNGCCAVSVHRCSIEALSNTLLLLLLCVLYLGPTLRARIYHGSR